MPFKKIIYRADNKPYLIRYTLFKCKWFAIRIHHILLSDDDCLHDHPWDFVSIILKGGYYEKHDKDVVAINYPFVYPHSYRSKKWYKIGNVLFRKAEWKHSLELRPGETCWTFVIMFKDKREWGFWTKKGWVKWSEYNSTSKCD